MIKFTTQLLVVVYGDNTINFAQWISAPDNTIFQKERIIIHKTAISVFLAMLLGFRRTLKPVRGLLSDLCQIYQKRVRYECASDAVVSIDVSGLALLHLIIVTGMCVAAVCFRTIYLPFCGAGNEENVSHGFMFRVIGMIIDMAL